MGGGGGRKERDESPFELLSLHTLGITSSALLYNYLFILIEINAPVHPSSKGDDPHPTPPLYAHQSRIGSILLKILEREKTDYGFLTPPHPAPPRPTPAPLPPQLPQCEHFTNNDDTSARFIWKSD